MSQHAAQAKVNRALKQQVPAASHLTYTPGDQVLVWREKSVENRIGEWIGPYTVETVDHDSKIFVVKKTLDSPPRAVQSSTNETFPHAN